MTTHLQNRLYDRGLFLLFLLFLFLHGAGGVVGLARRDVKLFLQRDSRFVVLVFGDEPRSLGVSELGELVRWRQVGGVFRRDDPMDLRRLLELILTDQTAGQRLADVSDNEYEARA